MATIKDIAKETGLGLATISKYLNGGHVLEKNRIAIEHAIDKLGYTVNEVARGLKTSRSRTIGVVIPELSNLFITTIVTVIEDILRKSGYAVIICDCRTDETQEEEAVQFLVRKQVDGIINMPVGRSGMHLAPALNKGLPVVLLDRLTETNTNNVNAVLVDNVLAAQNATLELLNAGHQNIGIILGPQDVYTSRQRLAGYTTALQKQGLAPKDKLVAYSDYTVQGGYESMKHLLGEREMSAVFVTNYEMTLGAIIAINETGIQIPQRLSFIGFDNLHLSQVVRPKLTIVTQPLEEIGTNAAKILLERLAEGGADLPPASITLQCDISAGESIKSM